MTTRKWNMRTFPFKPELYVVLEDRKEVWLKGSHTVAMGLRQIEAKHCPGYKLRLATREFIDRLKTDPSAIDELPPIESDSETTIDTELMKKTDPLTVKELTEASDLFFPLFNVVHQRMPEGSTTEDTLKIMESVTRLGHKLRADKAEEKRKERFGFNKDADS